MTGADGTVDYPWAFTAGYEETVTNTADLTTGTGTGSVSGRGGTGYVASRAVGADLPGSCLLRSALWRSALAAANLTGNSDSEMAEQAEFESGLLSVANPVGRQKPQGCWLACLSV